MKSPMFVFSILESYSMYVRLEINNERIATQSNDCLKAIVN